MEELIKEGFGAQILGGFVFGCRVAEEEIMLREARLDGVVREVLTDVAERTAAVATMDIDALAEELLHLWDEWELGRDLETGE